MWRSCGADPVGHFIPTPRPACGSLGEDNPNVEEQPTTPPKVFISYTHDSPAHKRRVLELAKRLRSHQIDARIDQHVEDTPVEWPEWTARQLREADLVLIVCTSQYRDAFEDNVDPGLNKGAKWEARFIRRQLYKTGSVNEKFVPVLLNGATEQDVPDELQGTSHYSPNDPPSYESLCRRITGKRRIVPRPLGNPLDLPAEPVDLPPLPGHVMAEQSEAYLQRLREETGEIRIGSIDRSTTQASAFPISDVYVPLHFEGAFTERDPDKKRHPLETALFHQKLIVQGDAGSGKSTFMRCAAFDLSQEKAGTTPLQFPERAFPLYIRVSELDAYITRIWGRGPQAPPDSPARESDPAWIAHFLASLEWGATQAFFESKLRHNKTVLLLDGLDEAPGETSRERMAKLLGEIARRYHAQCRIVVTTRPQALVGEARPAGFVEVSIAPFDDEDIALFVQRWCACKYAGEPARAERERERLTQALAVGEIATIAKNPLMLAALTVIHFNGGRLPDNRLELYEAIVRWLAESRKHLPGQHDWATRLEHLRLLALGMQTWPGGRVRSLEMGDAEGLLRPPMSIKEAQRCLRVDEPDSGILAVRGENIEFPHLTFQEYLAALELAGHDPQEISDTIWKDRRLYSPEWRETMRFLAAILRRSGPARVNRLFDDVIAKTGETLADRARTVALLWTMLAELRRRDSDGNAIEFRIANPIYEIFAREMTALFADPDAAPDLDARTRAEAAEAWESLGDISRLALPSDPSYWVDSGEFQIGKYPVTVWEFSKFVESGGPEPDHWAEQSRWPHRPVVDVDWQQAMDYCAWARAKLQTSEQWESAAAGKEGCLYPWGSEDPEASNLQRANFGMRVGRTTPVGLYPAGNTPDRCVSDLAGNVWEWTRTDYKQTPERKVLRGGGWSVNARYLRVSFRYGYDRAERVGSIGFRCVRE